MNQEKAQDSAGTGVVWTPIPSDIQGESASPTSKEPASLRDIKELNRESLQRAVREYHEAQLKMREIQLKARSGFFPQSEMRKPMSWGKGLLITTAVVGVLALSMGGGLYFKHLAGSPKLTYEESLRRNENWQQVYGTVRNALKPVRWMTDRWFRVAEDPLSLWLGEQERRYFLKGIILRLEAYDTTDRRFPPAMTLQQAEYLETVKRTLPTAEDLATPPKSSKSSAETLREIEERNKRQASKAMEEYQKALRRNYSERGISQSELRGVAEIIPDDPEKWPAYFLNRAMVLAQGVRDAGGPAEAVLLADRAADLLKKVQKDFEIVDQDGLARIIIPLLFQKDIQGVIDYLSEALSLLSSHHVQLLDEERELVVRTAQAFVQIGFESSLQDERNRQIVEQTIMSANLVMLLPGAISALFGTGARISEIVIVGQKARSESRTGKNEKKTSIGRILLKEVGFYGAVLGLVGTIAPLLLIGGHFLFGNKEPQVAPEANQAESTIQEVASTPPSPTRVQLLMDKIKNLKLDDATRLEAARELGRMIHKAEEDGNPQLAQEITDQFYEFFVWLSSDQFLPMVNNGSRFKQTSIYLWPAIWKDSDGIWHVHVIPADGGESYDAFAYVEAFATSPRAFEAFIKMLNAPIAADNFYMPYFGGQGAGLYPGQKSQKALESAIREREQLEKEPQSLGERKSNAIIRDFYKTRLEKVKSMPPFSEMRKPMSFKKLTLIVALLSAVVGISGTAYFYQTLLADLPNASPTERENRSWNRGIAYLKAYEMMLPTRKLSNAIFGQDDYLSAWLLARAKVNQIDEEGNLVRVVQFAPSKLWANPEVTVTTYEYEREDGASIPKKVTFSQSELRSEKTEKRTAEELARGDFNASASDGSRGGIRFLLGTLWRGLQGFPFYSFLSQFVSGGYSRIASVASRIMEITSPTARSEPRVNTAQFVKASIEYLRHLATDSNATLWGSSTSDRTHNPVQLLNHVLSPAIAKENQRATSDKKPPQEFLLQIAEQLIDRIGEIATDIFAEEYDAAHKGDMLWLTGGPMRDLRTLAGEVADQIKREIVVEEGSAANGKTNLGWFVRIDENIIASSGPSEYKLQFMTREVNALFEKFAAQLENKNSIRSEMRQNLIDQMMARLPSEIVTPVVYIALAGVAGYAAYQIWSTSRRPAEEQSRSIEDGVKNVLEILRERNFNEAIVSDKDFSDAVTDVYRTYKPYQLSDGAIADEILVSLGLRDIRSLSPDEVAAIIGQGLEEYPRPSLEITTVFFALSSYENLPQGVLYPDSPVYQAVSDFYASRRLNGSSLQDIIDELDSLLRGAGMGPHAAPQLVANVIRGVNQSELRQYEVILTNKELFQGILLAESFRQQLEDLAREFNSPEYVKKPAQEAIQGLLKADSDNRNGAARIARAKRLFLITAISQFGSTEARKPLADYFAWNGLGEKKFPLVAKFLNLVGKAMTVASHSELRSQEPPDFSAYFIPETLTTKNGWPESFRIRIDERYDEGSKERFDVDVLFSLNTDKDKSDRLDLKSPPRKLVYYITMPSRPPKEVSIDLNAAGVVETVAFDMSTTGMSLKLLVRIEAWLEKLKNGVPFNDKHPVFQGSEAPEVKEPDLQNSTLQSSLERILRQRYVSRVDIMAILSEADQLKKYKQTQNIDQIQFGEWGVREEGRLKFGEGEERLNAFQLDVKPPRLGDAEIESQLESLRETLQKFMPAYAIEFIKDFSGNGVLRLQFTWRVQKRNIKGLESKSDDATKVPITWNYSLNRGQEDWTITLNETSKTALKRPDPRLELTYEVQSTTTLRPIGTVRLAMSAKIGPDGSRTIDPKSEIKYTGYLSEWRRDTKTPEHSTWLEFNNFMQVARQSPWGFELKDRKKNLNPDILNIVLEPIDRIARQSEMRQTGPEIIGAIGIGVLAISALWGVNRLMLAERLKRASQTKFEYRPDNRSGVWRVEAGYKTFFATDAELRLKLGDYGVEITPKIEQDIADAKRNPIRQTSQSEMRQIEPEIIISAIGIGLVAGAILWADKRLRIAKGLERASKTKFEYRPGKGGGDWLVEVGYQTFVATDGELRSKLELYGVKITPKIERDIEAAKRNFVRQTSQSELRTEDEDKKELVRMAAGLSVREKPSTADEKNIIAGIILQARKAEALTPLQIKPLEQPEPSRVGEDRFQVEPLLREIGNRDRGIDGVEMLIFNDIQTGARAFNPATRSFEEAILPQLTVFLGVIELENLENDGKVHEYALLESPYQDKTHFLVRRSVIKKSQIELIRVDSGYGMRRIAFAPSTALPGALIRSPKVDLGDLILKDFGRTNLIHLPPMRGGLDLIEIGGARREIAAEAGVTVRITIHVSDEKIVTKEFRIKAGGTLGHILAQLPPQMPVLIAEVQGKDFQKRPLNFDEVLRPGDTVDLILYPNEMFTSEEESFYAKITAQKPLPMTKLNMDPILARIPESEKLGTLVSVEGADTAAPFIIFRVEIRTNVAAILRSMRFSLYNVIIAAVLLGETSLNLSSELEPGQEIRIQFGPRRPLKPAAPAPVSPITWPTTTVRPPASSESSNMNASRETEQHPLAKLPQRLEITSAPVVQQWVLPSTPRVGTSRSEMRTPDLSTVSSPAYVGYNEGNRKVAVTLEDRTEIMEVLTARFKELSAGKSFNEDKFDKEFLEFFNTAWGKSRLQSLKVIPSSSALIRGLAQISQDNLIYELIPNSGPATAEIENLAKKAGVRKIYFVFNKSGWLTAFGIWMDIVSPAERNLIAQRVSQRETQQVITRTVEAQRVTPWESLLTYLSEKAGVVRSGKEKTIARDFFITRKGFDVAGALTDHSKWEQVDDPVVLQQLEGIFARLPVKKFQRAAGFKVQAGTPLSDVEAALRLLHGNSKHEIATSDPAFRWSRRRSSLDGLQTETGEIVQWVEQWLNEGEIQKTTQHRIIYTLHRRTNGSKIVEISKKGDSVRFTSTGWTDIVGQISDPPSRLEFAHKLEKILAQPSSRTKKDRDWKYLYDMELTNRTKRVYYRVIGKTILFVAAYKREDLNTYTSDGPKSKLRDLSNAAPNALLHDAFSVEDSVQKLQDNFPIKFIGANSEMRDIERIPTLSTPGLEALSERFQVSLGIRPAILALDQNSAIAAMPGAAIPAFLVTLRTGLITAPTLSVEISQLVPIAEMVQRATAPVVDQTFTPAIDFLTARWSKPTKVTREQTFPLGIRIGGDDNAVVQDWVDAALADGRVKWLVVTGPNARAINQYLDQIQQAGRTVTTVGNMNTHRGDGVYDIPVMEANNPQPLRNPNVVQIGISDSEGIKTDPSLKRMEILLQARLAVAMLEKRPNGWNAVSSAEIRPLLKEVSRVLLPGLHADVLKGRIENTPNGPRLIVTVSRSEFRTYLQRLTRVLESKKLVGKAA
ncbi:MAG: hypothetical protein HYZ84_02540 [Candidatus Omnitrophica bacterium]|nr:hypothetical protein [Candidatus Omnitrophota bacterium]